MKVTDQMIPLEDALHIVDGTLAGVRAEGEKVPVRCALGRVLVSDQSSRLDLPPFDKSAMDGYAVLEGDERDEYRLLETVPAGQTATQRLLPGAAVKVMTGAPVPDRAGRVIIVENAEERGDRLLVHEQSSAANICWKGEDVRRGDVILRAGTVLDPVDAANLIACGVTEVEAARRVRLAVISTGDEIVDSPELLRPGRIMNSNGPLLAALAAQFGLEVTGEQSLPDDREAIALALHQALETADVAVLSGGVSVGEFDFVTPALADAGLTVHFTRVAVKPGKPMTYASRGGKLVFALPGNPVSVYLTFHLFVLRAAARMMGLEPPLREIDARLGRDFSRRNTERVEYVPARLVGGRAEPIEYHGSAHLTALTEADGFLIVPVGVGSMQAGEPVAFVPRVKGWR